MKDYNEFNLMQKLFGRHYVSLWIFVAVVA